MSKKDWNEITELWADDDGGGLVVLQNVVSNKD